METLMKGHSLIRGHFLTMISNIYCSDNNFSWIFKSSLSDCDNTHRVSDS